MKTNQKLFSIMILSFVLLFSINLFAQNQTIKTEKFIRVYNLKGKKIAKGNIVFVNDSILSLKNTGKLKEIRIDEIGKIKTKRSGGHNVLMGSVFGASLGVVVGVAIVDSDYLYWDYTAGEGALFFGGLGALGGAAIGGVTAGIKKTETYIINGDFKKWQIFREVLLD
jgi:hypothetical protein